MDALLINLILFVLTWCVLFLKVRRLNLYMILFSVYTINVILAYYLVKEGLYYDPDPDLGERISFIPLLCHYITTLIVLSPFWNIREELIDFDSFCQSKVLKALVRFSLIIFTSFAILKFFEVLVISKLDAVDVYDNYHEGNGGLITYDNPLLFFINGIGGKYYNVMKYVTLTFFISMLLNNQKKWIVPIIGIFLSVFPALMSALAMANRGGLFFMVTDLLFFYVIAKPMISKKTQNKIITIAVVFGFCVLLPNIQRITDSRFEHEKEGSGSSIVRYFGESTVSWASQCYDQEKAYSMGQFCFPEFGPEIKDGAKGKYDYWKGKTGVSYALFGTLYGDCYKEFGLIGAFVFIILIVVISKKIIFSHYTNLAYIPLVATYYRFAFMGIFSLANRDTMSHLFLIALFIICLYINKIQNKEHTRNISIL